MGNLETLGCGAGPCAHAGIGGFSRTRWNYGLRRCVFLSAKGLGVDAVDTARIRAALERHGMRFVRRILTDPEIVEIGLGSPGGGAAGLGTASNRGLAGNLWTAGTAARLAARFAAKEAVAKALGCGISRAGWKDIVILRGHDGPLRVELRGGALAAAVAFGVNEVLVSITHERTIAVAVAIAQGE